MWEIWTFGYPIVIVYLSLVVMVEMLLEIRRSVIKHRERTDEKSDQGPIQ